MLRMKKLKKLAGLLPALLLAIALAGCGSQSEERDLTGKTVAKIGYLPITHALAVFEETEMLEKADSEVQIELVKFSSWTDLTDALSAGRIDGASVLVELAMNIFNNGVDIKTIGLGHKDGNVVVVSDEIETVEDLKGKTFAIPSAQSSHNILLQDMLAEAGMSLTDISLVQLSPTEMPSSLVSGAIDGYCVAEPYGAQVIAKGLGHVLYSSEELWEDSTCCAFVLSGSWMTEHAEAAELLIENYFTAGNALDEETAMNIAETYLGQEQETLEQSLAWISFKNLALSEEDYQVLCDKLLEYGINENPPSYDAFVYQGTY
ncbi:MAG: ABC transporter substrate-binding protein [Lachnospiraceae bacterium]|nr:ABC transporter substrate-binding protein [Lachnospiraceae bacterium]